MKKMSDPFAPWLVAALCLALAGGATTLRAEDEDEPEGQPDPIGEEPGITIPADQPTAYNKASSLLGLSVSSQTGQDLGKLRDIVIDPPSGRVSYAVLGVISGFLGLNEKYLAVPLRAFATGTPKQCLVLNAEKSSVTQARGFDRSHWPGVGTPAWGAEPFWKEKGSEFHTPTIKQEPMEEHMKEGTSESMNGYDSGLYIDEPVILTTEAGEGVAGNSTETNTAVEKVTSTNLTHRETVGLEPTKFNRVQSLIGMKVRNPQDEELGYIKDIVVDLQAERVSYAVLARRATGGTAEKLFAVPLSAFRPSQEEKHLLLNAEKSSLETARGFPVDEWPSVSHPTWGGQPFWKELPEMKTSIPSTHKSRNMVEPVLPMPDW